MREKGDRDNFWNLSELHQHDDTLPHDHILDYFEELLSAYSGQLDNNTKKEKTFVVDDYYIDRDKNLVEGKIMTGDYGYTAELRDINTGNPTHLKKTDEAELIEYYFLFWLPKTKSDNLYEKGQRGILTFQQFNGRSFKTAFTSRFYKKFLKEDDQAENTMFEARPITTQAVLEKLLSSESVKRAEFSVDKMPQSDEGEVQLIEGLDVTDTDRQSIVLKPGHGKSLNPFKKVAKQLKRQGGSFAEIVEDPVEDLTVTVKNEHNREETFSLLDDELKMKKELEPGATDLDGGHPTTEYISQESVQLINDATPASQVKRLKHKTRL